MRIFNWCRRLPASLLVIFGLGLSGCASTGDYSDPRDPLEGYNRAMYRFNSAVDEALVKPLAQGYKAVTPPVVDEGVTNFFNNLADLTSAVNNLLQFKLSRVGTDLGRVTINTTVGVVGIFDVATNMGLPSYKEDMGQTFGYWGDDSSPYLVLPFLGPSTVRDALGRVGDAMLTSPIFVVGGPVVFVGVQSVNLLDQRADLLTTGEVLEQAAPDPYAFVRDAYLQYRRNVIFDGNPLASAEEEDFFFPEGLPTAPK